VNWIRVSVGITGDPRVYALADDLGIRPAEVVGLIVGVMIALPEHAPTGDLSNVPTTLLERWAGWDGVRGQFAERFAERFLDDGVWAAWEKHNGSAMRDAKSAAERAKAARNARKGGSSPNGSPNGMANGTPNGSPLRDETRRSTTTTPLSPPAAKVSGGWPAAIADAWTRTVGVISPGRVGKDLLPFVKLYPSPAAAESALVAAVRIYDDTCTRRSQSPKWVQFVAGVQGYVPQNQLPPTRVEVA
jgi:hypothetical protein